MSAMVLFRLEQALGSVVLENNSAIDEQIGDIADAIRARGLIKRPDRGCKKFCVNGHLAGNCLTSKRSEHDRSKEGTIARLN